jgi:hypothetical protein
VRSAAESIDLYKVARQNGLKHTLLAQLNPELDSVMDTLTKLVAAGAFAALASQAQARADTIRIGYQNEPDPSHTAIVDGAYEKTTGDKIEWRKFDSGASVIAALASNAIDVTQKLHRGPQTREASRSTYRNTWLYFHALRMVSIGEIEPPTVRQQSRKTTLTSRPLRHSIFRSPRRRSRQTLLVDICRSGRFSRRNRLTAPPPAPPSGRSQGTQSPESVWPCHRS